VTRMPCVRVRIRHRHHSQFFFSPDVSNGRRRFSIAMAVSV
jgi:hypothetical protein